MVQYLEAVDTEGDVRKPVSLLTALLAGAAIAAVSQHPASAADLSGTWNVSATYISHGALVGTATPVCTFQQTGGRLSGTCKGPNGIGPAAGTVAGGSVAWQWDHTATTPYGATGAGRYRGTVGADGVIRGTATDTALPGVAGAFTQQRQ
jgi:hypothetical protein